MEMKESNEEIAVAVGCPSETVSELLPP